MLKIYKCYTLNFLVKTFFAFQILVGLCPLAHPSGHAPEICTLVPNIALNVKFEIVYLFTSCSMIHLMNRSFKTT